MAPNAKGKDRSLHHKTTIVPYDMVYLLALLFKWTQFGAGVGGSGEKLISYLQEAFFQTRSNANAMHNVPPYQRNRYKSGSNDELSLLLY